MIVAEAVWALKQQMICPALRMWATDCRSIRIKSAQKLSGHCCNQTPGPKPHADLFIQHNVGETEPVHCPYGRGLATTAWPMMAHGCSFQVQKRPGGPTVLTRLPHPRSLLLMALISQLDCNGCNRMTTALLCATHQVIELQGKWQPCPA